MTTKEIEIQLALGTLSYMNKLRCADGKRTSKKVLTILSKDKNWFVRSIVVHNSNTPMDVLEKLSTDKDRYVRTTASWQWLIKRDKIK